VKRVVLAGLVAVALAACETPFEPSTTIQKQRFLAVIAEPLEAAPGELITFSAVMTNGDGSLYTGPFVWAVLDAAAFQTGGDSLDPDGELLGFTDIDPEDYYFQDEGGADFAWLVPDKDTLESDFGPPGENGLLLAVYVSGYLGGDPDAAARTAYKLFVVSERAPEDRLTNPVLDRINVNDTDGHAIEPNDAGVYVTGENEMRLRAASGTESGDLTYHWFATTTEFHPEDLSAKQTFAPGGNGNYAVYCIQRQSFFYYQAAGLKTRIMGTDWARLDTRFE
jgi:hypothetical protein